MNDKSIAFNMELARRQQAGYTDGAEGRNFYTEVTTWPSKDDDAHTVYAGGEWGKDAGMVISVYVRHPIHGLRLAYRVRCEAGPFEVGGAAGLYLTVERHTLINDGEEVDYQYQEVKQ